MFYRQVPNAAQIAVVLQNGTTLPAALAHEWTAGDLNANQSQQHPTLVGYDTAGREVGRVAIFIGTDSRPAAGSPLPSSPLTAARGERLSPPGARDGHLSAPKTTKSRGDPSLYGRAPFWVADWWAASCLARGLISTPAATDSGGETVRGHGGGPVSGRSARALAGPTTSR